MQRLQLREYFELFARELNFQHVVLDFGRFAAKPALQAQGRSSSVDVRLKAHDRLVLPMWQKERARFAASVVPCGYFRQGRKRCHTLHIQVFHYLHKRVFHLPNLYVGNLLCFRLGIISTPLGERPCRDAWARQSDAHEPQRRDPTAGFVGELILPTLFVLAGDVRVVPCRTLRFRQALGVRSYGALATPFLFKVAV